jgi:hypothetical protein
MARLALDEAKPGSKLKNRRESSSAPHWDAVPAQWLVPINQQDGRAFAFTSVVPDTVTELVTACCIK